MGFFSKLFGLKADRPKKKKTPVSTLIGPPLTTNKRWNLPKKRRIHSIGFHDETIKVTWADQKEPEFFAMTPFRHDSFIDSGEFYFIGIYLEQEPDGFEVTFNDQLFTVKKKYDTNQNPGTN